MLAHYKLGLAILILSVAVLNAGLGSAQAAEDTPGAASAPTAGSHRFLSGPTNASDAEVAQRRAGHMNVAERKLLRQHVEDAAREGYKR
ncbi:hypothetical protein [Burkholderia sp. L27(2015)]|uniref:hypothetical protein n=1 Tax=Burkholderia sp. L27(2015) TaxID=1641858 RepID=UPI00131D169A|nr:hypothetical protein [Burkholderia sp. L27(2015)]